MQRSRQPRGRDARIRAAVGTLAVATATGFWALPARADNLNIEEAAAALALPIITGGYPGNPIKNTTGDVVVPSQSAVTLATITNLRSSAVRLAVDMISGDPGGSWDSTSFECELTGRETTTFVFVGSGTGQSEVYVECSDGSDPEGQPVAKYTGLQNGILFVAAADPALPATADGMLSEDILFGDAIVVDKDIPQAYSFGAIGFQAGSDGNDGDKVYRFNGKEYQPFPAVLAANFIAPTDDVRAELILFTLDGTVANPPVPRAKLGMLAYNDDEVFFDLTYEFDCFDIAALEDINPNFQYTGGALGLGSMSGHIQMVPQPIATPTPDSHDAQYGDANNSRTRGVHGWFVQSVEGTLVSAGDPIETAPSIVLGQAVPAAWGRPLAQSTTGLTPFKGDLVVDGTQGGSVLDADVLR